MSDESIWDPKNKEHAQQLAGGKSHKEREAHIKRTAFKIAKEVPDGSVFLDFGCGHGRFLDHWRSFLLPKNITVWATDSNEKMLSLCAGDGIQLFFSEDHSLPFKDQSVDFIFSNSVLIHQNVKTLCLLFKEFSRIIRGQGIMVHDIMDGDNKIVVEEVIKNQSEQQPRLQMHCYSWLMVEALAMEHDFNVEIFSKHRLRNRYKFTKLN